MIKEQMLAFEQTLASQGLHSSLQFLNQRVNHRFTAVFRLDKSELSLVHLIDKLDDPSTKPASPVPFANSFCELVMTQGAVMTANSVPDKRFDGRFSQGIVIGYVGLPLVQRGGALYGTLCHLDYSEKLVNDDEFAFLQNVVGVLPPYL